MDRLTVVMALAVAGATFGGAMVLMPPGKPAASSVAGPIAGQTVSSSAQRLPTGGEEPLVFGSWHLDASFELPDAGGGKAGLPPGMDNTVSTTTCLRDDGRTYPISNIILSLVGKTCDPSGLSFVGGRIGGRMVCIGQDGQGLFPTPVEGTFTADGIHLSYQNTAAGPMVRKTIDFRRIGGC